MKNKRNIVFAALIALSTVSIQINAVRLPSSFDRSNWNNLTYSQYAKGAVAIAAVVAIGYGLYRFFRAPSNEKLCSQARTVYNRINQTYGNLKFVKYPNRMKITKAGDLFELTNHKDLPRIKEIGKNLPELKRYIALLSARINKNSNKKKTDDAMQSLYDQMCSLAKKLEHVDKFWNSHASFFGMHEYLTNLSSAYSKYDYNNALAVRMQIRGDATGKRGDAYTYPFKTFSTTLSDHINRLHKDIQNLRAKARSFSDRELIANEYYNMISQAEPFHQALIYLRDVAVDQPEYAIEMKQIKKAKQKQAELEAQKHAAETRAQAEREKAEAIRYKAHLDYLATVQKQAPQTNVTVVNQTKA